MNKPGAPEQETTSFDAQDTEVAAADRIQFVTNLDGGQETPPVEAIANGSGMIYLDRATKKLLWDISYNDLSSPVTAAHFHGPAGPGAAAGVQLKLAPTNATTNRIVGEATLTDEQMRQVLGGLWYLNIHTKKHPDGEIRGQVENSGM
ncbi:MAG: CHRD domain-containing protein [Dongiaceae bacterium]